VIRPDLAVNRGVATAAAQVMTAVLGLRERRTQEKELKALAARFEVESSSYMSSAAGWYPQANTHASIRVSSRQSIEALVGV
jgi:hypothetical protein